MELLHNSTRGIEAEKEKTLRRFSLLRDHLSPQIVVLQNQLEECCTPKASFNKLVFIDLNVVELVSYALCALLSVLDVVKDKWKKNLEHLKVDFSDLFSKF